MKVFGVSTDDVVAVGKFHEKEALNFPLLSDPDASASEKYDVFNAERFYASRVTFVIDPKGVVRAIDDEVSVASHGADLVARIKALQGR